MKKLIKHKWKDNDTVARGKQCERCLCLKYYDYAFVRMMYMDRFGITHYRAPECVLPNTKL